MKEKNEIESEIERVKFDMEHIQNYDKYKFFEGILVGLKWVLDKENNSKCPECDTMMIKNGLPSDDGNHIRMLCPKCGKWKWNDE